LAQVEITQVYIPNRNAKAAHLGAQEPVFGRDARSALFESALVVFGVVETVDEEVREDTEQDPKTYSEESEAVLPGVEAIDGLEREGVGSKEGEEDGKCESRVEAEEENSRLRDQHLQWAQQGDGREYFPEGEAGEFGLGWWVDVEAFGAARQDDFLVGLRHAHYWEEGGQGDEDGAPLSPSPALVLRREPPDYGTQSGPQELWLFSGVR
jgi:hypothetical protein